MKPIISQIDHNIFTVSGNGLGASLLKGKYGNYLFGGIDASQPEIKDLIRGIGGVKYQFPLVSGFKYDHLPIRLFKVFGSQMITMSKQLYSQFADKLPCFDYQERSFTDLAVKVINHEEYKLGIRFRGKHYRLPALGLIDSFEFIEQILIDLKKSRYVFHYDENTNSIAFFDDIEFERNDYEVISPGVRNNFSQILGKHQFKRIEKSLYSNGANKVYITPPPRVLMSNPIDELRHCPDATCKIVTPTQMAILILEANNEEKLEDLISLASVLPFNMKKLETHLRRNKFQMNPEVFAKIKQQQFKCLKFYKFNRSRDGIGKKFEIQPGA